MINRDEIDPQGAIIRQTAEAGVAISEELTDLNPNVELDAKEFGEHVRNGGWRLGLLVARSVRKTAKERGSKPWEDEGVSRAEWYRDNSENSESSQKISASAFAHQAGVSITDKTVTKYLNAWNQAAVEGFVPLSSSMCPGQGFVFRSEFDLDFEFDAMKFDVEKEFGGGND